MPKPRPLTPFEARRSLAHKLAPRVDRLRQFATRFGIRPYRVFLVWTKWTGEERGDGKEVLGPRMEILPTPKVENLDSVNLRFTHGGMLPFGTVRVSQISALFTSDQLRGIAMPTMDFVCCNDPPRPWSAELLAPRLDPMGLPDPLDFYWELVEDGRGDEPPERMKFRLQTQPFRDAGDVEWRVMLERVSTDALRDGSPNDGYDP